MYNVQYNSQNNIYCHIGNTHPLHFEHGTDGFLFSSALSEIRMPNGPMAEVDVLCEAANR